MVQKTTDSKGRSRLVCCSTSFVFETTWGNGFKIWYRGEVTSIMKVTLFWDVITYGLVATSQQFKRICCLLLQNRSLFHPEDGDSMLFQNVGTFFQTTCGYISEHSNLNSPHHGHIKSRSLNFGLQWFLFKRKLFLITTNFVTNCSITKNRHIIQCRLNGIYFCLKPFLM
jgi:hypothetical protein